MPKSRSNRGIIIGAVAVALAGVGVLGWQSCRAGSGAGDVDAATCNICGTHAQFQGFAVRKNAVCPKCRSKERHRLVMHYLEHETNMWSAKLDVLHFSPDRAQKEVFQELSNLNYVTADYFRPDEDLKLDLTDLAQPDNSWDALVIYHILEHIPDDKKAMREMYRVLRPGGRAFVQVPIEVGRDKNYEDPSITTDQGRSKAFGQKDHVRKYGRKGFKRRLKAAGFKVEVVDYISQLPPETVAEHRMSASFQPPLDESIWVLHKPLKAAKAASETPPKKEGLPSDPTDDAVEAVGERGPGSVPKAGNDPAPQ